MYARYLQMRGAGWVHTQDGDDGAPWLTSTLLIFAAL